MSFAADGRVGPFTVGGNIHWRNGVLYTTSTSANVRTGFTVAFAVLTALTALVGALFLKRRNQRQLLKDEHRTIKLNHLASWMTVTEIARYWWKTKHLPAGGYAWIMLAVGAFELTSHIFVSRFILASGYPGQCDYTAGIWDTNISFPNFPLSQLAPANIAVSAQIYNTANGAPNGIYNVAVQNETFFVGQNDTDYLGAWNCTTEGSNQTYPQSTNYTDIYRDLLKKNLLFEAAGYDYEYHFVANRSTEGVFIWTASVGSDTREVWDVKAAFSTEVVQGGSTTMTIYNCQLNAGDRVKNTVTYMQSNDTLSEWAERTYGLISLALFDDGTAPSPRAIPDTIGRALNAATMVAATGNNLLPPEKDTDHEAFGCLRYYTAVSVEIIIAIVIVWCIFWFFVVGEIFFVCVTMRKQKLPLVEDCPGDLASWQTAMLNDLFLDDAELGATGIRKIQPRQISNYSFGWVKGSDGHDRTGYKKAGSDDVSTILLILCRIEICSRTTYHALHYLPEADEVSFLAQSLSTSTKDERLSLRISIRRRESYDACRRGAIAAF